MMEVAENLHMIKAGYLNIYTTAYLIAGKKLTLIDTGELESWDKFIKPYIRQLNRRPEEVSQLIIMHNHDDHMSGARQIKKETGATVAAGGITAQFLANPQSIMEWEEKTFEGWLTDEDKKHILEGTDYNGEPRHKRQPFNVDRRLKEGDIVEAAQFKFQVLNIPGHTLDSIGLYEKEKKILLSGDTISGGATDVDDLIVIQSINDFVPTLRRLEKLEISMLLMSHPYLPLREAMLNGTKAKEMIKYTIEMSNKISEKILEVLKTATKPMTTPEISSVIASALGPHRNVPLRSHGTVRLILVKYWKEGRITATKTDGEILWTIKKQ